MQRVDVFAHVLPPEFYAKMREAENYLPRRYTFFSTPTLTDMHFRRNDWDGKTRQVISLVNALPEDYVGPDEAALLCRTGNEELIEMRRADPDMFEAAVLSVPMNNMDEACRIVREDVASAADIVGVQIFTRACGLSIASPTFRPLFAALAETRTPCWLHPVFDTRKPDNNIVFSWEYELTQAMMQMVQEGIFTLFPNLKVICHHAGGMVPYFAGRIEHIMGEEQAADFRRFYVDTAILGNPGALKLAYDYYGPDHILLGTDAPLGQPPAGATAEILAAIDAMDIPDDDKQAILADNYYALLAR